MLLRLMFGQMWLYQHDAFFPAATLEFRTEPGRHYHVPLTWSGFGYSTYRGS
jgi:5-hydroxyisourate hydrolase-like protein (transthyretin family)